SMPGCSLSSAVFTLFVTTLFPGLALVALLVLHARTVNGSPIGARTIHMAGRAQPATTTDRSWGRQS
ncbi:MAG: hypothetical protein V1247_06800, partial [Acidimicrobiales bacterium]|nr:hypothetical protein [Acidimicrobiales bacterium]